MLLRGLCRPSPSGASANPKRSRRRRLSSLKTIRELKPAVVIPGHSKRGAPLDATSAVTFTERYLLIFEELNKARDPDDLIEAMKGQFQANGYFAEEIEPVRICGKKCDRA